MAKPHKRQPKREQRTKCEYFGCSQTFGRKSDSRRHMEEQHGSPLHCPYPGCEFNTKRAGKLKGHLSNVHHREITTNLLIPSEFPIATAHSQGSTNHFSIHAVDHEVNMNFNATRPALTEYTDYAFTSQGQPEIIEPYSALSNDFSPPPKGRLTFHSVLASKKGLQSTHCRVYKPCRVRRRPPYFTSRTSSASPSQAQLSSAKESSPDLHLSEQSNTSLFSQWIQCAMNVEPISEFLDSLGLDLRLTETATYGSTIYSNYSEVEPFKS